MKEETRKQTLIAFSAVIIGKSEALVDSLVKDHLGTTPIEYEDDYMAHIPDEKDFRAAVSMFIFEKGILTVVLAWEEVEMVVDHLIFLSPSGCMEIYA